MKSHDEHNHQCSEHDHDMHRAEAINAFRTEAGDEDTWTPQQTKWHQKLLDRVDLEDGYDTNEGFYNNR